jgi:hypothetical protein
MKPKSSFRSFLLLTGSSLLAISSASAAPYYWDIDGAMPGSGPNDNPAGNWTTGGTTWSTNSLGDVATPAYTTTIDKDATGIYGGRIVFANGTANTGYDWATSTGGPTYTLGAHTGYARNLEMMKSLWKRFTT